MLLIPILLLVLFSKNGCFILIKHPYNKMQCVYIFLFSEIMEEIQDLVKNYSPEPFKLWLGPFFAVTITKPKDLQVTTIIK